MKLVGIEIVGDFRGGSSWPALVRGSNDRLYVVKWKGTAEGVVASITDLIGTNLARTAGILVPQTSLIVIQPDLCYASMDAELKDLVLRSIGTNLAIEFLPEAIPYAEFHLTRIDEGVRDRIFLFDLLMLNIDRVENNPNMLLNRGDLFCIDFSASMTIRELLTKRSIAEPSLLSLIRRHPFYSETVSEEHSDFQLNSEILTQIVENVTDEWLDEIATDPAEIKRHLKIRIANLIQNRGLILQKRIPALKGMYFQSAAERRQKSLKKRNDFLSRLRLK